MISSRKRFFLRSLLTLALTFSVMTAVHFVQTGEFLFRISVLSIPEHEPFDGTVYPFKNVPNWSKIDSSKFRTAKFSEFSNSELIDAPVYDPDTLEISTDTLKWGNEKDNKVRNAKITYSVPYLGNYKLDGVEYAGSHPAVDIKMPEGTPIYAIANGTVVKASIQGSGFGNHIVIQHNNFPTLGSKSKKDTLYSSYSHMSDLLVEEGDVVTKGKKIGLSGETGTATTPHLHFQLDNSNAPWHPFWPFTSKEASEAGLDFFSAINEGLGQESAKKTTVNPLIYVNKYLDPSDVSEDEEEEEEEVQEDGEDSEESEEEEVVVEDFDTEGSSYASEGEDVDKELTIEIETKGTYKTNSSGDFEVNFFDQFGEKYVDGFDGELVISSDKGNFSLNRTIVLAEQVRDEERYVGFMKNMEIGKDRIRIEYRGEEYYSEWFEIEGVKGGEFTDVDEDDKYFEAVAYLADQGIINGYEDGTFKPDKVVNRVEALKFILEGTKTKISSGTLPFKDTSKKDWYAKYLYTSFKKKIVEGYTDGTFKPAATVNTAEFYKMLFNGMKIDVNPNVIEAPYEDVPVGAWFTPYISYAKELGVIDSTKKKAYPSEGMTRGEVAYAIYKLMLLTK